MDFLPKKLILVMLIITTLYVSTKETTPLDVNHPPKETEKISNPRKRTTKGAKKAHRTLKQMPVDELAQLQKEAVQKKNFSLAIKCVEQRMKLVTNPADLADLIVELGELQFESGKLDLTIITLNQFKKEFPGHKEIEEVHYKTCVASFLNSVGSVDRDQTNTEHAIALANEYLAHPDHFKKYRTEVEKFREQALHERALHELNICKFHKKNGHIQASKKRLEYIEKEFGSMLLPELSSQILALKEEMYTIEHNKKKELASINNPHKHKNIKDRF